MYEITVLYDNCHVPVIRGTTSTGTPPEGVPATVQTVEVVPARLRSAGTRRGYHCNGRAVDRLVLVNITSAHPLLSLQLPTTNTL